MLKRVSSGGQTGVDQAALRAATACQIPTGGWAPAGWKTEAGLAPWLTRYGMLPHPSSDYKQRTIANVREADLVALLFVVGQGNSPGTRLTRLLCSEHGVECFEVEFYSAWDGGQWKALRPGELRSLALADTIRRVRPDVLLVAGNRESKCPGIGAAAEAFLVEVFTSLMKGES